MKCNEEKAQKIRYQNGHPFEFKSYEVTHLGHGRKKNYNTNQHKKTLNLCLHKKQTPLIKIKTSRFS